MHTGIQFVFGFCAWDLPALILLAGLLAGLAVYAGFARRRERELEDELAARMAQQAFEQKTD